MEDIRNLYMNVYGDTLRKIIENLDTQLRMYEVDPVFSEDELKFLKDSILIACEIYTEYNTTSEIYEIMIKYSS